MPYVAVALLIAVFTINCAWATGPQEQPFSKRIVKCCVKSPGSGTAPRCIETTAEDCFKQRGTEVKDCAQCK
jgi:hypothetical protein